MTYRGKAALVTGASSGIGEAFARALAARSMDVLLTALPADRDRLDELAQDLSSRHHVRTAVIPMDLGESAGACRLQKAADELGFNPDTLVNSAGYGAIGSFGDIPLDQQLGIIRLNVEALVALTGLYLPRMTARRHGAVINVASTAALAPIPYFAVYAASKAFVLSFSEAIWAEYRKQGVRVVAACPGPTATRFHERSGNDAPRSTLKAHDVVDHALSALDGDRPTVVQRVLPAGVIFAALSAPVAPRRLRILAIEQLARRIFKQ
jgi:short-subunit dehydrogenase